MYRAIPTSNKLLQKKWADKEREIHLSKLREIKPTVEIREPSQYKHLKKKLKKTQMLEDRYTEIERENRILLEKMTNIMQNNNKNASFPLSAGSVNAIQTASTQSTTQALGLQKKSLNREARKRELLKITMENQAFLRRLQDKQPNYNVYRWEEEEQDRKKILKNICEYDYIIDQPGVQSQMQSQSQTNYNSGPPDYIIKKKGALTTQPLYKKRGYTSDNNQNSQYDERALNGTHQRQQILYNGQDLFISAQHVERSDSFVIEIQNEKVQPLINEFKEDYALMAEHLKIMNKRMVLLNPVSFSVYNQVQKFTNRQASKSQSPDKQGIPQAEQIEANNESPLKVALEESPVKSQGRSQSLSPQQNRQSELQVEKTPSPQRQSIPPQQEQSQSKKSLKVESNEQQEVQVDDEPVELVQQQIVEDAAEDNEQQ
ncbi:UNKNOWN [Stylonychia lemnae]|uniref:Uncharacterized protein n=1 Tax=Stylonychia lemnae TaxID=5949 RepID=A0A078AKJ0_STYLE|nr:UNKNOWN [Stylonychia lemnae]|eukprot:CDW81952.1 UNKNOWN [Stylonychia lemnae]